MGQCLRLSRCPEIVARSVSRLAAPIRILTPLARAEPTLGERAKSILFMHRELALPRELASRVPARFSPKPTARSRIPSPTLVLIFPGTRMLHPAGAGRHFFARDP